MTAAGFLSITVSSVRAGASGVRRPPSQCLMASRLKPKVSEKRDWVMPSLLRMLFTSTSSGTCTLKPFCSPARKASTPSSHELFKCVFHRLSPIPVKNIVSTLLKGITLGLCQIRLFVFGEDSNQKNREFVVAPDVDNTRAAP